MRKTIPETPSLMSLQMMAGVIISRDQENNILMQKCGVMLLVTVAAEKCWKAQPYNFKSGGEGTLVHKAKRQWTLHILSWLRYTVITNPKDNFGPTITKSFTKTAGNVGRPRYKHWEHCFRAVHFILPRRNGQTCTYALLRLYCHEAYHFSFHTSASFPKESKKMRMHMSTAVC
jgi:hypothetical protein